MKRSVSALTVAAAVAVMLCGCGTSGTPLHKVNAAVNKTLAVTWARYALALKQQHLFASPIVAQGGRAAYDFRTRSGYEFLQLQLRHRSSQTLFGDLTPTTFLVAPSPAPAGVLPAGKAWISVPLTRAAASRMLAAQAEGLAPAFLLDEVAWGARAASSEGTDVVESVPMEKYRVSVDLVPALSAARKARRVAEAAAIEEELHASNSRRVPISVWVSGPGYVGKIESKVPGSGLGTVSFVFSSYTKPYTGAVPPASQIVPLASLKRGGHSLWDIATGS
jgi:hypothetical protein